MRKKLIAIAIAACATLGACADTWTDPDTGYMWIYQIYGDKAEIYNYYSVAISPSPTGALTIPSTLGGKPVTRIGSYAFQSCSGLTSVTIPDNVTSIKDSAFYGCSGLTAVYIADLAKWCGIWFGTSEANPLCCAHKLYLNGSLVRDLTIPSTVTRIGSYAFQSCRA